MCGIGGVVRWGGIARDWQPALEAMSHALAYRGPDGSGVWIDRTNNLSGVALVHRRLAIIDLPGGGQPMANEDGRVRVVFNGEIYNHRELRRELEQLGHRFATDHSDTEVLIHGWEQWGRDLPGKLLGMFAFAVWDGRGAGGGNGDASQGVLFLCRDRMGQKPLFYAELPEGSGSGGVVFGSTLGSVLAWPEVPRRMAQEQLGIYLMLGYMPTTEGGGGTIYRNISQVPPGHWVRVRLGDHGEVVERQRYWNPPVLEVQAHHVEQTDQQDRARLRELLSDAVETQLMADVPLVCFLSGGIDSSIVALLMQRALRKTAGSEARIKTVSVGFSDALFDETAHAQMVAEHIQSEHTRLQVDADGDVLATLRHLVQNVLGQPFADSSIIPTYHLSQAVRAMAPVALSGDGGDELFGGYDRYRGLAVLERYRQILRRLPMSLSKRERWRRLRSAALGRDTQERYTRLVSLFLPEDIEALGWPRPAYVSPIAPLADAPRYAMLRDQLDYLPGDVLWKVDSAAMACGLEVRSPFLDHRVVEWVNTRPTASLIRGRTGKRLLRQAFGDQLPAPILSRKKQGFGVPIGSWIRGPLADPIRDLLLAGNSFCRNHLNPAVIEDLLDEHHAGRRDHTHRLFALLMLELWFQANSSISIAPTI